MTRWIIIAALVFLGLTAPALGAPTCDALEGEDPLYGDAILAFAHTIAPPGCDRAWSQAMRARRNAKPKDGVVVREETWGLLVEETAEICTVDGAVIEAGTMARLSVRCETWYRCADGAAEVITEMSCERAP